MPRFFLSRRWLPRGACLLVACALLGGRAEAQTADLVVDPFAPKLEGDPNKPPTFQKAPPRAQQRADAPATFAPIPPGAGLTGFDATNARKKVKPKPDIKRRTNAAPTLSGAPNAARASSNARTQVEPVSPYQIPPPPLDNATRGPVSASNSALPPSPGAPPVEIGPIRKPPKKRAAPTDDPYAPLGVHVGAFDVFPAVELIGGYNTNPAATPGGGKAAWIYTLAPELLVNSNWSRHELKAELRGSYYGVTPDAEPALSRPYFSGKIDGRIDVTKDTRIDLETRALMSTDNPGSPNLQAGLAKLPLYTTVGATAGITQRFNRFEVTLKGDEERTQYQESLLTDGTKVSNDDRNYNQLTGTLRGSYELLPGVKPFVAIASDSREHDIEPDSSGFFRNSKGDTVSVGSTFAMANYLTGEASIGYTRRVYDDPRFAPLSGLIGNASLVWTASALTTVKLSATSTVGESTIVDVPGILYRDVGLQVDHAFRRWLIGSVKVGFGKDDYVGIGRIDTRYSAGLGLTYKMSREVQVKGEIRQDWLRSNMPGNDYTATTLLVGMRFQR